MKPIASSALGWFATALIAIGAWAAFAPETAAVIAIAAVLLAGIQQMRLAADVERLNDALRRARTGAAATSFPIFRRPLLSQLSQQCASVSEQHDRARRDLESERLQRQLFEQSMRDGLVVLDAQQRVLSANAAAARLLGFDAATAPGRLFQELGRIPEVNAMLEASYRDGERRHGLMEPSTSPGSIVDAAVETLRDEWQQPVGALLLVADVTSEQRLERMRSDFAANVSHELRTPITNIKGYIETIQQIGFADEGQVHRFLEIVERNASRLAALVEDLLSISFLESPNTRERITMASTPVNQLIDWVDAELGLAAEARGVTLKRDLQPGLRLHANALLIEQAIGNLVSNAIRYAPRGSAIEITARASDEEGGGMARITVVDQGPGIHEKHLPRLFERFYRVDTARSRDEGGTGLGLAIVKHIAMVHGGEVSVESAIGRGSRFCLAIPVAKT
ncbi:MAG: PAS domain S-box protein [Planctomycetes bacterium]|nr:PAS domain S-box protein [Planctomycetota bacterium]